MLPPVIREERETVDDTLVGSAPLVEPEHLSDSSLAHSRYASSSSLHDEPSDVRGNVECLTLLKLQKHPEVRLDCDNLHCVQKNVGHLSEDN